MKAPPEMVASRHWQEPSRDVTSLDAGDFISYMNMVGWTQDGVFSSLLSDMGHRFEEEKGRMVTERLYSWRFAPALTLIIFEL